MSPRFPCIALQFATIATLALLGACEQAGTEPAESYPPSSCDEPVSDDDLGPGAPTDFSPGIEDELAALDLSLLPESIDISSQAALYRGFLAYALDLAPTELGDSLDRDETRAAGPLGEVVLGALLEGQDDPTGMDFSFFRRGFQRYATCSRAFPPTLDAFRSSIFDFFSQDGEVVDSAPKCGDRRLRTSPPDGVYVAETLVDGLVRETEILLSGRRNDGQLDFVTYDEAGQLSDRSLFPTLDPSTQVLAAVPYTCMTCHVDKEASDTTWGFSVLMPIGTGACALR